MNQIVKKYLVTQYFLHICLGTQNQHIWICTRASWSDITEMCCVFWTVSSTPFHLWNCFIALHSRLALQTARGTTQNNHILYFNVNLLKVLNVDGFCLCQPNVLCMWSHFMKQGFIESITFVLFPWPFWSPSWWVNVQGLPFLIPVFSFSLSALLICISKSQKNIHGAFQSAWIFYEVPSNPQAGHLIPTETDIIESKPPNERLPKLFLKGMGLDDYDYNPPGLSVNCWISLVRPSTYWTLHFTMIIWLDLAGRQWFPHMWLFKKLQRKLNNNVELQMTSSFWQRKTEMRCLHLKM